MNLTAPRSDESQQGGENENAPTTSSDERASLDEQGGRTKPTMRITSSLFQFDKEQLVFGLIAEVI